jgi:hypothetical protein
MLKQISIKSHKTIVTTEQYGIPTMPYDNLLSPILNNFKRVIYEFTASNVISENENEKYLVIKIKGSSFVYNQIRFMIGLSILVLKNIYPSEMVKIALNTDCIIPVPKIVASNLIKCENGFDMGVEIRTNKQLERDFKKNKIYKSIFRLDKEEMDYFFTNLPKYAMESGDFENIKLITKKFLKIILIKKRFNEKTEEIQRIVKEKKLNLGVPRGLKIDLMIKYNISPGTLESLNLSIYLENYFKNDKAYKDDIFNIIESIGINNILGVENNKK